MEVTEKEVKEVLAEMMSEEEREESLMRDRIDAMLGEVVLYAWKVNSNETRMIPAIVCSGFVVAGEIVLNMVGFAHGFGGYGKQTFEINRAKEGMKVGEWRKR